MSNEIGIKIKQKKRRNRLIEIAVIIASVIILAVIYLKIVLLPKS